MTRGYRGRLEKVSGSVRRPFLAVLLTLSVALAAASPSQAIVTIGSDLKATANDGACGFGSFHEDGRTCLYTQASLAPSHTASSLTVPFTGIVVRWRIKTGIAGAGVAAMSARVRTVRGMTVTGGIAGGLVRPLPLEGGIRSFDTRLPVEAGDRVGVDIIVTNFGTENAAAPILHSETGVGTATYNCCKIPDGTELLSNSVENTELLLNADIEPDADRDGFGDETQDLCPANQAIQAPCPDRISPRATASFAARQNFLVTKELVVRVGTDEAGTAIGTAQVRIKGKKKPLPVFTDRVAVTAGQKRALHLRVPGKTRKAVAAALANGKKASARVAVKVVDAAGNESAEQIFSIRPVPPKKAK